MPERSRKAQKRKALRANWLRIAKQKQEADEAEKKAEEKRKPLRKMEREFHAYVNAPMPRYDWPLPGDPKEAKHEEESERESEKIDRMMERKAAEQKAKQEGEAKS